jgi:cell division septum initiation protein DivIVA
MENIINSILQIEQTAKDKLSSAQSLKNEIIAGARAEEERIINDKLKEASDRLKVLEDEEMRKYNEMVKEIEKRKAEEIKRLDAVYEKQHKEWEDEIFDFVINGG